MVLVNGLTKYERTDDGSCNCHFRANVNNPAENHHEFLHPERAADGTVDTFQLLFYTIVGAPGDNRIVARYDFDGE